jgi:hypothetical protein
LQDCGNADKVIIANTKMALTKIFSPKTFILFGEKVFFQSLLLLLYGICYRLRYKPDGYKYMQ